MATFEQRINADLTAAMKAKDKQKLRAIRAIKSGILLGKTDGSGEELNDEKAIKILTKMAKQRKDSLDIYEKQGREDLATIEREELSVIETYLPAQMTEAQITAGLKEIMASIGATSIKDMGKVMGMATKKFAGQADGKVVSNLVKTLLK
jgi:uncharacterized protein